MITILKTDIKKIKYIIQFGDVHCRLNQRVEEYREVFNEFFQNIKDLPADETIIVNTGDIFHNKNELQPEGIQLVKDLLIGCSKLFPTIIIAGNHDAILSNKSRLDSISPIVDMLNKDNIFYLKDSGLYAIANILFNNMSVFDTPDVYIRGETIPAIYRNKYDKIIGLFHGAIDLAMADTGHVISNPLIMLPLFDNHHIVMAGDIHKMQDMQEYDYIYNKPIIRYAGSLIQQNNGEALIGHGYSVWDIETNSYVHYDVKNKYGFFTIEIDKGNLITDISNMPHNVRLRVICRDSIPSEIKAILSNLKLKFNIIETSYIREVSDINSTNKNVSDINLKNIFDIDYQNELISKYLIETNPTIDKIKLDGVLNLNRRTNNDVGSVDYARNLKYKFIKFEWDNMFTYGENNYLNFTNMNGVYGIFGKNRCGKSSILSRILFCLFDKFDRGTKGNFVLNSQKSSFKCKLELEIDGIPYFIQREGTISRTGAVKVDVTFWRNINGVNEELHGTERSNTNDIIRSYIGTYDDFILTTAAFQCGKNNLSFIDMGNSDRKDVLVKFIGINIFDSLYENANEAKKEIVSELKIHKGKEYQSDLVQTENALAHATILHSEVNIQLETLKLELSNTANKINGETLKLISLDSNIPTNITQLINLKLELESKIQKMENFIVLLENKSMRYKRYISMIDVRIARIEKLDLISNHTKYKNILEKMAVVRKKIDIKKIEVRGKIDKTNRLKTHKYDPTCKFCIDNSFVKDATAAKSELKNDKIITDKLMESLEVLELEFQNIKWVDSKYELYTRLLNKKGNLKDILQTTSESILNSKNNLSTFKTTLVTTIDGINTYNRNQVSIDNNKHINSNISTYRLQHSNIDINIQKNSSRLTELYGKMEVFKNNIINLKSTIESIKTKELELDIYEKYISAIGRDGIPYKIICNAMPAIEKEVNEILVQITDFTIKFETDGQNVIPYLQYEYGKWNIELASGYERFVAELAIRVALIHISNLPRNGAIFIDEGFSVIDSTNITSMITLFSILKPKFENILIISHLDSIKDCADHMIEIKQIQGASQVQHT